MNLLKLVQFTPYRAGSKPIGQPWVGIGPVWDSTLDQRVIGVSVQFGRRGFAIHRRRQ